MTDDTDYCAERVRASDLDRYLAALYAPPAARAGLLALHALDIEMAAIVRTTTEPMLGEIRLAWWREQLGKLGSQPPPAQPVLAAIATHVVARGVPGARLDPVEDGFLGLLDGAAFASPSGLAAYAEARGATLFGAMLELCTGDAGDGLRGAAAQAGRGWALVEALRHLAAQAGVETAVDARTIHDEAARAFAAARAVRVPPAARSIFALARLGLADLAALRSAGFDAVRTPWRRGTPGRQARLLWSVVSGRA